MTSSDSSVNEVLRAYLAGRVPAEKVVSVVAAAYYGETRNGKRETWRPIMDIVDRAHPGFVELKGISDRPGFAIDLAERPFPKQYENDLRRSVDLVLQTFPVSRSTFPAAPSPKRGLFGRIVAAIRRVFSA